MSHDTTVEHAAPAEVRPGDAVWLHAVRNSSVPLAPGYQKLMEQLREDIDAITSKGNGQSTGPALPPAMVRKAPPVPKHLREMVRLQQQQRLDLALASWSNHRLASVC